jgi:predicted MFS family arabinose efflux permease
VAVAPWRSAQVRRLWLVRVGTELAEQLTTIALLWFVVELTGSGAAAGLVVLCCKLPAVATSPLAGRLLDLARPRLVMAAGSAAQALAVAAVPALHWRGGLTLGALCGLAVAAGAAAPVTDVGAQALLPRLVDERDLEPANALLSVADQLGFLVGPAAAGFLVAAAGGPPVLLGAAALLSATTVLLWSLPDRPDRGAAAAPAGRGGWLGFGPLLADPGVRAVMLLTVVFFFAYGPLEPALPFYSRDVLEAGAAGYGLLWSAFGVGALAGLLSVRLVARARPGLVAAAITVLWGLLLAPLARLTSLPPAMLFLGLAAFAWAPYDAIVVALVQRRVPAGLRARALGARRSVTAAGTPLGAAAGGLLLGPFDAATVIGLSALACLLAGAAALLSPSLRTAGTPPSPRAPAGPPAAASRPAGLASSPAAGSAARSPARSVEVTPSPAAGTHPG